MNEKLSISKLNFYDNEVKAVVDITNNPVLKKYGFAVMNVTMDISDADCIDYSLKGSLLKRNKQSIGGDYTFMKGIQMGSDVIITTECAREVEKCVKYLFSKLRKTAIECQGNQVVCVLFEHSTKDSSCSYMPFSSCKEAEIYMKNKYDAINRTHYDAILEELSEYCGDSAKIICKDGDSIAWQVYEY